MYLLIQYIEEKHYARYGGCRPLVEELSNINVKCDKYRSRSPGQGTCQAGAMR